MSLSAKFESEVIKQDKDLEIKTAELGLRNTLALPLFMHVHGLRKPLLFITVTVVFLRNLF